MFEIKSGTRYSNLSGYSRALLRSIFTASMFLPRRRQGLQSSKKDLDIFQYNCCLLKYGKFAREMNYNGTFLSMKTCKIMANKRKGSWEMNLMPPL